jgi:hypothetical protein
VPGSGEFYLIPEFAGDDAGEHLLAIIPTDGDAVGLDEDLVALDAFDLIGITGAVPKSSRVGLWARKAAK